VLPVFFLQKSQKFQNAFLLLKALHKLLRLVGQKSKRRTIIIIGSTKNGSGGCVVVVLFL
tara:strand:- start:1186 stop:1365 length:180 start_codon:yes stop_codon:yes gene_type:complete